MSDGENTKSKTRGGSSWSEHEVLVYLLSAIEYNNTKIDFANSPAPVGRNANSCVQKMFKIKNALRAEIDAIKNGESLELAAETTPKKAAGRKRKTATDGNGDDTPKKRGRGKKVNGFEVESETHIKDELEGEFGADIEAELEDKV